MRIPRVSYFSFVPLLISIVRVQCWTTEDMELFDLVESTSQNFYDVLGVDKKASASDIRKAYRKLSTLYHPDKNKNSDAEETFRKIAAIADVLRDNERRKTYDLILQTGLPDWRMPIYYYRRVRNMGLLELTIFLFGLATLAQYLFAWSSYWEKKYEIEEMVLSKLRRKSRHQRKGRNSKFDEALAVSEEISNLPKPRCTDLFPIQLCYFLIKLIKSSPSYAMSFKEFIKHKTSRQTEIETDEKSNGTDVRVRTKKCVKPQIPDYSNIDEYENTTDEVPVQNGGPKHEYKEQRKWKLDALSEADILEFKKALKKFPNGTLQRWEKVAAYLDCSVHEVVGMVKELKNQQVSQNIPISVQGVTGTENFEYSQSDQVVTEMLDVYPRKLSNGSITLKEQMPNGDKVWRQEEQKCLELALQKYPKGSTDRWDRIAEMVSTKTKEECVGRYKILVQQVKKKKDKLN